MKISRRGGRLDLAGQSSQLVDAALTNGKTVQRFQQWLSEQCQADEPESH